MNPKLFSGFRSVGGLVFAAALCWCLPANRAEAADGTAHVSVTVFPEKKICPLPADFTGLSFEKNTLASRHFDPTNSVLVNLISNLGPGVLRFGGSAVDATYWSREAGKTFPKARATLGPADLNRLLAFSAKTHWPVILGLNLGANDPAMAADEAAFTLSAGTNQVLAFEIGNEPEHYKDQGIRATNYNYADFRSEVHTYVDAIRAQTHSDKIAGPATTSNFGWFENFLTDFKADTVLATRHHYPLTASSKVTPDNVRYGTVENLLSAETSAASQKLLQQHEHAAEKAGVPFRVGETGSASMGGKDGVSDVFASALWCVDYMFALASKGVAGVNFHGYFSCHGYTPFCFTNGDYHAHPMYYGLLFFHQAGIGRLVGASVTSDMPVNVTAYAVLADDGGLRVVLINKDLNRPAQIRVATDRRYEKAELMRLTAPSVMAEEGVTLGGAEVRPDGTWFSKTAEEVACERGGFELFVPAASAVLVQLRAVNVQGLTAQASSKKIIQ
jgi:hypothetical protein